MTDDVIARCDVKFSQIEGNGRKFSYSAHFFHLKLVLTGFLNNMLFCLFFFRTKLRRYGKERQCHEIFDSCSQCSASENGFNFDTNIIYDQSKPYSKHLYLYKKYE